MCSDEAQKICCANVCTRWLQAEHQTFIRPKKKYTHKKNRDRSKRMMEEEVEKEHD